MKIVLLTGSPHKNGSTALLADKFIEGARAKNHHVIRFDTAFKTVGGCRACDYCRSHNGACIQKDDMNDILQPILEAHMVAFVTPLYYYGISSQLKSVIDRFYAVDKILSGTIKSAVLLATCHSHKDWAMEALTANYHAIVKHMHWEDRGMVLAQGVNSREEFEQSPYPQKAKDLAMTL